ALAAGVARFAPCVVEQGRLPRAVSGIGQHPPAFTEPGPVLVQLGGARLRRVGRHLHEVAQLVAELHQHAVLAPGQQAPAALLRAALLAALDPGPEAQEEDRKSTRLNSSHVKISYAVFCLKKKIQQIVTQKKRKKQST